MSSNNLFNDSKISDLARFNSSRIIQWPFLIASTKTPSVNTSLPLLSGKYVPIYSSISVC